MVNKKFHAPPPPLHSDTVLRSASQRLLNIFCLLDSLKETAYKFSFPVDYIYQQRVCLPVMISAPERCVGRVTRETGVVSTRCECVPRQVASFVELHFFIAECIPMGALFWNSWLFGSTADCSTNSWSHSFPERPPRWRVKRRCPHRHVPTTTMPSLSSNKYSQVIKLILCCVLVFKMPDLMKI